MEEKRKELEKLDREFIKKESPVIESKVSNSTKENLEETKKYLLKIFLKRLWKETKINNKFSQI